MLPVPSSWSYGVQAVLNSDFPSMVRAAPTILPFTTFTITHDQILTLNARPVILVPAPGPGFALDFRHAAFFFKRVAGYAGGSNLFVSYASGGGGIPSGPLGTAFLNSGSTSRLAYLNDDSSGDPYTMAEAENVPLMLQAIGAEYTGGAAGNLLTGFVEYRIWPTGF